MNSMLRQDGPTADIHVGEHSIASIAPALDRLRQESGQGQEVLASTPWFLSLAARSGKLPLVVLLQEGRRPYGAVLLQGSRTLGVPSGVFKAGTLCGRGAVIGAAARRHGIAEEAASFLLRTTPVHTVVVTLLRSGPGASGPAPEGADGGMWRMRETRSRLSLAGGMEGLTARFSYKMRRNFRYYKNLAEKEFGCVFLPELTREQSRAAVEALHDKGIRPHDTAAAMQHEAALQAAPDAFAAGLQDSAGNWLSYLAGWRQPGAAHVHWQLNLDKASASSLSTAMRHYWLVHETSLGTPEAVFVGGTSPAWGRACEPEVTGDLLATRTGLPGLAIRGLAGLLKPTGQVSALHGLPGTSFLADP